MRSGIERFIAPSPGKWYLYVLRCKKDKYYVGITKNLKRRLSEHYDGIGANFTKKYPPEETIMVKVLGIMSYHQAEILESKERAKVAQETGKKVGGEVHDQSRGNSARRKPKGTSPELKKQCRRAANEIRAANRCRFS